MIRIILLALFFMVLTVPLSGCKRNVPPPEPVPEKPQADDLQKLLTHLKERLDRIEVQQSKLARQMEDLETKPILAAASEGVDVEQIIEEVVAEKVATVSDQKVSAIALSEIKAYEQRQEEDRQAERERQRQERDARREEREQERVAEMAQQLSLNQQQTEELLIARAGLRNTMREVFEYMREQGGFDRDMARETISELQAEHEKILNEFMTAEQVKTYLDRYGFNTRRFGGRGRRN